MWPAKSTARTVNTLAYDLKAVIDKSNAHFSAKIIFAPLINLDGSGRQFVFYFTLLGF